jgi:hypothetical protein
MASRKYLIGFESIVPQFRKNETPFFRPIYGLMETIPGYHIIVTTISSKEEAIRYVTKLNQDGFPAMIASKNDFGHFRISLNSFIRKQDALEELAIVRKGLSPDAWLLRQ